MQEKTTETFVGKGEGKGVLFNVGGQTGKDYLRTSQFLDKSLSWSSETSWSQQSSLLSILNVVQKLYDLPDRAL